MNLTIISLGAGVQSTTMALMAAKGLIEPFPDACIFADTKVEPKAVTKHLEWLKKELPFPIHIVSKGNLKEDTLNALSDGGNKFITIPVFSLNPETGKKSLLRRQCTNTYKIQPIKKKLRELLGLRRYEHIKKDMYVEQWIGISMDEIGRMKPARDKWITNRHPLIEMRMSRQDCYDWLANNYPYLETPRSACTFCPFRNKTDWLEVKKDKDEWQEIIEFDKFIRDGGNKTADKIFLHSSCKPIDQVDFDEKDDQLDMFNNECEGMCGV
tara:strand:+ start:248 stop:1054 length:807 start_codon:yes stop_codon:yes gene_type:complete